ncbi:hypothetical protein AnigIFM63604_002455 [Aspergillus niger]|uniref:Uncharacterized protein n=1 Tax=Aspergillus niger TaxID=5061 RepID=A0A9W6A8F0_ASPNG|nr:hypothetical protein AnigIFM63604_002455 [Aspergillus niger]
MLATAFLHGLPAQYRGFKEKYNWIRSTKPDDPPDLDYLYERLHVEEAKQLSIKEEGKANEKTKKDPGNNTTAASIINYGSSQKPRREDKGHSKGTYPECGKTGQTEEDCWTKNPEKIHS